MGDDMEIGDYVTDGKHIGRVVSIDGETVVAWPVENGLASTDLSDRWMLLPSAGALHEGGAGFWGRATARLQDEVVRLRSQLEGDAFSKYTLAVTKKLLADERVLEVRISVHEMGVSHTAVAEGGYFYTHVTDEVAVTSLRPCLVAEMASSTAQHILRGLSDD